MRDAGSSVRLCNREGIYELVVGWQTEVDDRHTPSLPARGHDAHLSNTDLALQEIGCVGEIQTQFQVKGSCEIVWKK